MVSPLKSVTATEASRHFSDLLDRVQFRGEAIEIKRGNTVVARISPAGPGLKTVADLKKAWAGRRRLAEGDAEAWEKELDGLKEALPLPSSQWD